MCTSLQQSTEYFLAIDSNRLSLGLRLHRMVSFDPDVFTWVTQNPWILGSAVVLPSDLHISNTAFAETSVFAQGTLVLPLRKGDFCIVHGPNVVYVPFGLASVECIP